MFRSPFLLPRLILVCAWAAVAFSISLSLMSPAVKARLTARPLLVSFRQSTEACIKLVQISASSDLYKTSTAPRLHFFPLRHHCGETFIAFHMSLLLHFFLDVGPIPNNLNLNLYRRSGFVNCLFAFSFRKP